MERVCVFGPDRSLVGVLSLPEGQVPAGRPAVILVNGGLVHRVGPFRLYVDLGRRLAETGFLAFRFDPVGFGDSEGNTNGRSFDAQVQHDVVMAIEYLAACHGCGEFVLFGLCSGADNAYHVAVRDRRVVGMIWIDGFAYRTPRYYLHWYLPRIISAQKWISRIQQLVGAGVATPPHQQRGDLRKFPTREELRAQLNALINRGCRLQFLYTGGYNKLYNHRGQLQAAIGRLGGSAVAEEFYPSFDHIFTLMQDRATIVARIGAWTRENFASRAAAMIAPTAEAARTASVGAVRNSLVRDSRPDIITRMLSS